MKIAKVVSVRERGPLTGEGKSADLSRSADEDIADALRRYPRISEPERRRLVRFLRRASRTEIRDAILRVGLEPRLLAFRKDHKDELRRGWRAWAPYIVAILLFAELLRLLL